MKFDRERSVTICCDRQQMAEWGTPYDQVEKALKGGADFYPAS